MLEEEEEGRWRKEEWRVEPEECDGVQSQSIASWNC